MTEAEDVAQDALLRLHQRLAAGERIDSARAYIVTVTTRLAIDQLRSARARRETYVGEWLPEPIMTGVDTDPSHQAEMADSLSFAFLVLLESLSPEQRAVFLLREVFDYGYDEIAAIVGKREDAVRQLASRARRRIERGRPRFRVSPARREELAKRFFAAARDGDLEALEALLAEDVVLHGDGGGKVPALARPLRGRSRVAGTLLNWSRRLVTGGGATIHELDVNGQPGALVLDAEGRLLGVTVLEVGDGGIEAVHSIVNPDKLRHLRAVGDLRAALERGDGSE